MWKAATSLKKRKEGPVQKVYRRLRESDKAAETQETRERLERRGASEREQDKTAKGRKKEGGGATLMRQPWSSS
uniref:Uncharacterized protein n=1 Tax=Melanopsichium pennsylvanicum 4 TaxID=1398559 RepID=A0A077QZR4_9BASI|nr:uncharacterized protein BN887_06329 [Melanopsichium pennsylvanicum 4]